MSSTHQPAENLLIRTADVVAILHVPSLARVATGIRGISYLINRNAVVGVIKGQFSAIHRLKVGANRRRVYPRFAIVMEVRINALEVKVGAGLQHVIQFGGEAIAGTVILVSAKVGACEVGMIDPALVCNNPRPRLEVINPAPIPIVSSTQQEAELLVLSKALAIGSIVCSEPAATDNVRVSSLPSELKQRPLSGGLGHEVH